VGPAPAGVFLLGVGTLRTVLEVPFRHPGEQRLLVNVRFTLRRQSRYAANMCSEALDPAGPHTSATSLLTRALSRLGEEDLHGQPGRVQGEQIRALYELRHALDAAITRRVEAFDASGGYAAEGALSTVAWLRAACRLGPGAAAEQVRVARRLRHLPRTQRAFAAGRISLAHAAVIVRSSEEVGLETARQAEPDLLRSAHELHPPHLRRVTRHLRHCVDPDGELAEAMRQREGRYLHLSEALDGVWYLDGSLDAEGGGLLRTTLEAIAGPPRAGDGGRGAAQRRADALVDLAGHRLDSGELPQVGGQRPHLTVTADLAMTWGRRWTPCFATPSPITTNAVMCAWSRSRLRTSSRKRC